MRINSRFDIDVEKYAYDQDGVRINILTDSGITSLTRWETIKLRNYLNDVINGNLDEQQDEE